MIGLAGAHRTGKTSLARESARALGLSFVETSVSSVFETLGVDPGQPMDFQTRLMVQSVVLKTCIEQWGDQKGSFITDRTPIDMLAYTMADIQGDTLDSASEAIMAHYTRSCIKAANDYFGLIVLVQPGIPLKAESGKAALSAGYIEHLNVIMAGLLIRRDLMTNGVFLNRETLDMERRINGVRHAYNRAIATGTKQGQEVFTLH
jgi:predicted ATPase